MMTTPIEPTIVTYIGPDASPPEWAIDQAVQAANESPCQKRKVGISIYRKIRPAGAGCELVINTLDTGYNGPPGPVVCHGTRECRDACSKRCVHAETRAIYSLAQPSIGEPDGLAHFTNELRMVHVKLDDAGRVMACDGPSCIECSKLILDVGIGGIWLFEQGIPRRWIYYTALRFHEITSHRCGLSAWLPQAPS